MNTIIFDIDPKLNKAVLDCSTIKGTIKNALLNNNGINHYYGKESVIVQWYKGQCDWIQVKDKFFDGSSLPKPLTKQINDFMTNQNNYESINQCCDQHCISHKTEVVTYEPNTLKFNISSVYNKPVMNCSTINGKLYNTILYKYGKTYTYNDVDVIIGWHGSEISWIEVDKEVFDTIYIPKSMLKYVTDFLCDKENYVHCVDGKHYH